MAHFVTGLQPALMESAHRSPHQGHSTPSHQGHFPPAHQGHHPPSHTPHPPKPKPPTSIELHHVQAPSEVSFNKYCFFWGGFSLDIPNRDFEDHGFPSRALAQVQSSRGLTL